MRPQSAGTDISPLTLTPVDIDYASAPNKCCESSAQFGLIHLCMCDMFSKVRRFGGVHCYALARRSA